MFYKMKLDTGAVIL